MSYRFFYILFIFYSFLSFGQEIEVLKVAYEKQFNYFEFHNKKTVNHDEIDTSRNIALASNNFKFDDLMKCKSKNCCNISTNDIIISSDFILPSNLSIKDKLNGVEPYLIDYLDKLTINQRVLKKRSSYVLYQNELKNVIIITLRMTISYYNARTANLKLCENPNDKIIVYRFLNGNDEYEIKNKLL